MRMDVSAHIARADAGQFIWMRGADFCVEVIYTLAAALAKISIPHLARRMKCLRASPKVLMMSRFIRELADRHRLQRARSSGET